MRPPRALLLLLSLALALPIGATGACNLDNLGDPPPDADIYLPTGMLLSAQGPDSPARFLYVINSNFDLRYNRGSVQAFDLAQLETRLGECATPGLDCQVAARDVLVDEVLIPSLATSFAIAPNRNRLYVATRTDPSISFIDLNEDGSGDDVLRCDDSERRCSARFQRGANPDDSPRGLTLPSEPVGIATLPVASAAPDLDPSAATGDFMMVAHRGGQVSLFHDAGPGSDGPRLVHLLENLPLEPTGIAFDPVSRLAYLSVYARTTGVFGLTRLLSRIGITAQPDAEFGASFTYDAGSLVLDGAASQRDTRGVLLNPATEGQMLVVARDPASLMFVDVGPDAEGRLPTTTVPVRRIAPVGDGPLRMALGQLGDRNVVAITCFDGHSLYILDAASADVLGIIHNLNGPFELAIDSQRQLLYVADFRSSTIQVIDLEPLVDATAGPRTDAPIIGALGIPKVVQELQ